MEAVNGDALFRVMGDTTKESLGVAKSHFRPCPVLGPEQLDGNEHREQGWNGLTMEKGVSLGQRDRPMDTNRYMTCRI